MSLITTELLKFRFQIVLIAGLSLLLGSCDLLSTKVMKTQSGYSLGTSYAIKYEASHDSIDYTDAIEEIFVNMNESMSTYLPNSLISRVNKGDSTIVVDDYFEEVFHEATKIWKTTNGAFDPTVGVLVNAWGFGPGDQIDDLTQEKVDSLLNFVGMNKVEITAKGTVRKDDPNIFLDFNALAKGYTIDLIGRFFDENNVENYLIEIGGEILTNGINTDKGADWAIAIEDPRKEKEQRDYIATVTLRDRAMATSGNYRKYRIDEATGELFVHTINAKTGYPKKSNILSVSVIAPTCTVADAYATAFLAMDIEDVKKTVESIPQVEAYLFIAGKDGQIEEFITPGFQQVLMVDKE